MNNTRNNMIDAVKLADFNIWANRKISEQVKSFPDELFTKELGGSFPSIRLTLLHLLSSDWIWMHRWKGIPIIAVPSDWTTDNAVAIIDIWSAIQNETLAIVKELAATPDKIITFTTKKGASFSLPFLDLIIHVTNHGTYHRGQIVNMIRMLGEEPVNTDYFIYCTTAAKER